MTARDVRSEATPEEEREQMAKLGIPNPNWSNETIQAYFAHVNGWCQGCDECAERRE